MVEFADFTPQEELTVDAIAKRAAELLGRNLLSTHMDISAVSAHTKLRLNELLDADNFNFAHDIVGIANHLDRTTGKLMNCFVPRFSVQ